MKSRIEERREMVHKHIRRRGVTDRRVLDAMIAVPREVFVPQDLSEYAYADAPLPIQEGQTISQPFIVALMVEALKLQGSERVLEVGTGSGYAAAVLGQVATDVFSVERHGTLADLAASRLESLGYTNVHVRHADGTQGWIEKAPFDAIVVAAGGPDVPEALLTQLAPGGRLVIPVGVTPQEQVLVRVVKDPQRGFVQEDLGKVRFVPLIGEQGWRGTVAGDETPGPIVAQRKDSSSAPQATS